MKLPSPSLSQIREVMARKGHAVFTGNREDYNLNIVGIRNPRPRLDIFGCQLAVFWRNPDGEWEDLRFRITTYPGSHYLITRLLNRRGCAILAPGQYRGAYRLDTHNGKYEALCQRGGTVQVYRDGNRNRTFDLDPATIQTGHFGINIHKISRGFVGCATHVLSASAGCQVFPCSDDFEEFLNLCRFARARWGNRFTYTLLDGSEFR